MLDIEGLRIDCIFVDYQVYCILSRRIVCAGHVHEEKDTCQGKILINFLA